MVDIPGMEDMSRWFSSAHFNEHAKAFARIDLEQAWGLCGGEGNRPIPFERQLFEVLRDYNSNPITRPNHDITAKKRDQIYARLEKSASTLRNELQDLHEQVWNELLDSFTANEPPNVDDILVGENEGLTYGEYQIECILESLAVLTEVIPEAKVNHKRPMGRPKQNENLERTIHKFGGLYASVSGEAPMKTYRYNEVDADTPYQGPFLNFLCATLWAYNGRKFPSNNALGEATRIAFSLRK
jgi:hypothetical protein